jgi:hypothetical protein
MHAVQTGTFLFFVYKFIQKNIYSFIIYIKKLDLDNFKRKSFNYLFSNVEFFDFSAAAKSLNPLCKTFVPRSFLNQYVFKLLELLN